MAIIICLMVGFTILKMLPNPLLPNQTGCKRPSPKVIHWQIRLYIMKNTTILQKERLFADDRDGAVGEKK